MIYVDITSSIKYRVLQPNGIVRTELECINYVLKHNREDVGFCMFDYDEHRLVIIDRSEVKTLLFEKPEPESPAKQSLPEAEQNPEIIQNVPLSFPARIKRMIWKTGGKIYRGLPAEIREHFRVSVMEAIEMVRSTGRYFRHKLSRSRPAQPDLELSIPPGEEQIEDLVEAPAPSLTPFGPGDVFICLGFMWDYLDLEQLYKEKTARGFHLITLMYDLIPILMPEFAHGNMHIFSKAILNQIWASDGIFCISDHTMSDLNLLMDKVLAPQRIIKRIHLGSNPQHSVPSERPAAFQALKPGKFILCVGTMEPRKNHEMLFQVWRALYQEHPGDLIPFIIVGSTGWHTQELRSKIQLNPWLYPRYINWFSNVSDEELEWLYKNCRFTVYPSLYEGWGLPITEAINRGKFCISSNAASMVEAGQGITELIDPLDFATWKDRIHFYMTNDAALNQKEVVILERRQEVHWETTFRCFFADIEEICSMPNPEAAI